MNRFARTLSMLAALTLGTAALAQDRYITNGPGPVQMRPGESVMIEAHGDCRIVENKWGQDAMVPFNAPIEWNNGVNSFTVDRPYLQPDYDCFDPAEGCPPSPDPRTTLVSFILDESGSMLPYEASVRASVNEMLQLYRDCGQNIYISIYKFSDNGGAFVRTLYRSVPIGSVGNLTDAQYNPAGQTPIFDATWQAIADMDADVNPATYPARANWRKVVIVQTDGLDNRSFRTAIDINGRVNNRESGQGWQFMYLGTNNGAAAPTVAEMYDQANRMGINGARQWVYPVDDARYRRVFRFAAKNVNAFASGDRGSIAWTNNQIIAMRQK